MLYSLENLSSVNMEEKSIFLLAPIGPPGSEVRRRSDNLLEYVILPAAAETGYKIIRADDISRPGNITAQIIKLAVEVPIVIADLSGRNPNVLYELGIRHATGKPAIQISTDRDHLPFDVAAIRTIILDVSDLRSIANARMQLTEAILEVEEGGEVDSPVSAAVDLQAFEALKRKNPEEESKPLSSPILNVLKNIENRIESLEHKLSRTAQSSENKLEFSRRIFIVHGHDGELKNELARFLERLDFEPVILHDQPDKGQTIFAKLSGELADIGFAFIILTPDDVGNVAPNSGTLNPRARQNVIFEHGLFAGYLSPNRVCAIRRGNVETPSDLHGVLYKTIASDGSLRSIAIEIANELRAAGYILDANKLLTL